MLPSFTALRASFGSPRLISSQFNSIIGCRALSTAVASSGDADASAPRRKYKSSFKRASSVMAELEAEAREMLKARMAKFPKFEVGDAIEVSYTPEVGVDRAVPIRGTVMAMRNTNLDSSFRVLNAVDDDMFEAQYPFNSPLLKGIKVLQKYRATDGQGPPRRAKLYYLKERAAKTFDVSAATKEKSVHTEVTADKKPAAAAKKAVKKLKA